MLRPAGTPALLVSPCQCVPFSRVFRPPAQAMLLETAIGASIRRNRAGRLGSYLLVFAFQENVSILDYQIAFSFHTWIPAWHPPCNVTAIVDSYWGHPNDE